MTTKACLEDLIKYLTENKYMDKATKDKFIATLYRGKRKSL